MSLNEMKKFTFVSRYSNYLPDKKRRETFTEAVDRYKGMMVEKYKGKDADIYIDEACEALRRREVLGSQRSLQFAGQPILKHNARSYNCISSYVDRIRFFQECIYLLLCGCGTGFSVQKHHVEQLPKLVKQKKYTKKFVIEDSIEGWADAIGVLVSSFFDQKEIFSEYTGYNINFDPSNIRKAGSRLSYSSAPAPGPEPLIKALKNIDALLNSCLEQGLEKVRPIHVYDIVMFGSDCVLAGGIRRSATIALFSPDDDEMVNAKIGNWYQTNPQRARSNNSAMLLRDNTTFEGFKKVSDKTRQFGEPGYVWVNNLEFLGNPCLEIGFYAKNEKGESGWQACNLSTINCSKIKNKKDFFTACRNAAILGTLQAGFTDFPYLGDITKQIVEREALIGVSMTGIMENPDICLDPDIQKEGARIVKETNKELALILGINAAARTTCVKPEGSSSCMLGTSSGIHPHHAKRYIRRVQSNKYDKVYQFFKTINPGACERSVWSNNNTDEVISFCVEVPDGSKLKNQVSALELLESVKSTQKNWVNSGKNKALCTKEWLSHNVSNTIQVKEDEWDEVIRYIYDNRNYFCGISLLPMSGDKDYPQAPFTTISLPSEINREYGEGSIFVSGLIERALDIFDDDLWKACSCLLGMEQYHGKAKKDWVKSCQKFAENYMIGDIKKLTYCMKDVYNWKRWLDLNRSYKNVDFTQLVEEENSVKLHEEIACSGGRCEI